MMLTITGIVLARSRNPRAYQVATPGGVHNLEFLSNKEIMYYLDSYILPHFIIPFQADQ